MQANPSFSQMLYWAHHVLVDVDMSC